jgi:ADP-ribose pyrophosphatase YjhB (NUDIX family)
MDSRPLAAPVVNGVVMRAASRLETLLWQRDDGSWSLPGGFVRPHETLDEAMARHLREKVGVERVGHIEQLSTKSLPDSHPDLWLIDVAHIALLASDADPQLPPDTDWHAIDALPSVAFGHRDVIEQARERLRGKLSYSNIAFALAPQTFTLRELARLYGAVLGRPVDPTNLGRVLERDGMLVPTGDRRPAGESGGRPAAVYAFRDREYTVTRPYAAFRPPPGSDPVVSTRRHEGQTRLS